MFEHELFHLLSPQVPLPVDYNQVREEVVKILRQPCDFGAIPDIPSPKADEPQFLQQV
jgi:hypothetical protein